MIAKSGAEDQHQRTASALAHGLVRRAGTVATTSARKDYTEAEHVISVTLKLSDAALLAAGRSREGRVRAVGQVEQLYGLLALCRLQLSNPAGALEAVEAGRQRFSIEARTTAETQAGQLNNDPATHAVVEAAEQRRLALLWQLGNRGNQDARDNRPPLSPAESDALLAELDVAQEELLALYRQHKLIPEIVPMSATAIIAAAPAGGALVLPVIAPGQRMSWWLPTAASRRSPYVALTQRSRTWTALGYDGASSQETTVGCNVIHHARGSSHETTSTWQPGVPQLVGLRDEHAAVAVGGAARPAGVLPGNTGAFARRPPVVLLPTGLLGLLPLQAAQQDADATPFGERWTVSLAPSVRTLLDCRERATAATAWPPRPLGLLDPDGSLPGARKRSRCWTRLLPVPNQVLIGNDATTAG